MGQLTEEDLAALAARGFYILNPFIEPGRKTDDRLPGRAADAGADSRASPANPADQGQRERCGRTRAAGPTTE